MIVTLGFESKAKSECLSQRVVFKKTEKKSSLHQNNFVDDTSKRQEATSLPGSNLVESFGHRKYGEASYRGIRR